MARAPIIAAVALAGLIALSALVFLPQRAAIDPTVAFDAPGIDPMTLGDAQDGFWQLTPALLLVVYQAFGATQEDDIYDTLSQVTHADALEYLYLERVGAMAGGGLDEADQTIHEIKLLSAQVENAPAALHIDASWQVIGTVGHAEHLHVRGNTYRATLAVAPVEGAWRITDFELLDVSRDSAGETFLAPQTNG